MSLELGDIESASKKLSVAIRADPNCNIINTAYSKLKKIRKSVKSAKKDLKKTYNKRALTALESALEGTKHYNLTTQVLKGKLMLDLCLVMARVRRHEKAVREKKKLKIEKVFLFCFFCFFWRIPSKYFFLALTSVGTIFFFLLSSSFFLVTTHTHTHNQWPQLIVCNEAIDLTNVTMDGLFMDTGQLASAFIARGQSLMAGKSFFFFFSFFFFCVFTL